MFIMFINACYRGHRNKCYSSPTCVFIRPHVCTWSTILSKLAPTALPQGYPRAYAPTTNNTRNDSIMSFNDLGFIPSRGNDGQYVPGMTRETLVRTPPEMAAMCFVAGGPVGPWWGVDLGQEVEVAMIEIRQSCKYGIRLLRMSACREDGVHVLWACTFALGACHANEQTPG